MYALRFSLLSGIYALVDTAAVGDAATFADQVLSAGVRVLQLRAKAGVERPLVRTLLQRTRRCGAVLIVNDDIEASLEADGLHLGQDDALGLDLTALRRRLGERVLGLSTGNPGEARAAAAAGADYVAIGPMYATASKADAGPAIGVGGVQAVARAVSLPVVAIGGITLERLPEVAATGAAMAAVISALAAHADPQAHARALVARWSATAPRR